MKLTHGCCLMLIPCPPQETKNRRFSNSGIKIGNRRLSGKKPQIPALHSWYPDWLLWWTPVFTPSPSVRALSLSRNTTFDLASFARKSCLTCIVSFPRVVYVACFRTWKERSSPVCISLWFSRTCKTGVRDFPALICFNPWWWCGAVSRFWDLETVRDCLLKAVSEVTVCVSRSISMLLER